MRIARLVAVAAVLLNLSHVAAAGEPPKAKKLIEWGWDEPNTKFMRENVAKMEELPFDGVIFHVDSSKGGGLTWEMWGGRKFDLAEFEHAIADLKATPFRRLTDRFLRVNVCPGSVDWFDDRGWDVVLNNFTVAAQVAKQGGSKGFMFDVEQYNEQLFDYGKQKHKATKSFDDYRAKVRQRGSQWMKAVHGSFPEIVVLMAYAYSITGGPPKDRVKANYGLVGDFLDGMFEAASPQTRFIDGWEGAYTYKKKEQFQHAYDAIKVKLAELAADPQKYRSRIEAGFGIWMDCNWRQAGWHTDDLSKNFFKPAEFENSVRLGLERSDEYVWIYTEKPLWWINQRLPQAYIDALRNAKARHAKEAQAERIRVLIEKQEAEERALYEKVRKDPQWRPSHEEKAVLKVGTRATRGALHNFCMNLDGNLLVCWGGTREEPLPGDSPAERRTKTVCDPTEIRVLSPDGRLLQTWKMDFEPQAICVHRDGTIFVGGDGRLAKLNQQGKVLASVKAPNLDPTPPKAPATPQTPEAKQQAENQAKFGRQITGIAASDRDLFIAGGMSKGFAYAVWRTDHQLGDPKKLVEGLRGCCNLLDVQTRDGELWVAENARHRILRYNRDGKELAAFGKRDRTANSAFGCCEPKNIRFGPDGDLYCAQSETPTVVKRFTPKGEFRGVVALSDFKCGCARVTIEVSKDCREIYVLDPATDTIRNFVASRP